MTRTRQFGLLLHPTSLPGRFGIGDIGWPARDFISLLNTIGASVWQFLPLHPTSLGNSPYSANSAFAGNPLIISIDRLLEDQWLLPEEIGDDIGDADAIDFDSVRELKNALFHTAFKRFQDQKGEDSSEYCDFFQQNAFWLEDYSLFCVLKKLNAQASWLDWPEHLKNRHPDALISIRENNIDEIRFHYFLQFIFFSQWKELREHARMNNVILVGDMPVFVALDSADVWSKPYLFDLDSNKIPVTVAGVPPDYFSPVGQKWGNPHYNWSQMEKTSYSWWIDRFRVLLSTVDIVRVDHFRGFEKYWSIPAHAPTAETGEWKPGPGRGFFDSIRAQLGALPVIAEDLGVITPEVEQLRDSLGFPGMKIMQFAFGGGPSNPYLLHNHRLDDVVYTGTHDNNTITGWWNSLEQQERDSVARQIEVLQGHPVTDIRKDLMRMAMSSVCHLAIFPVQDVLGLDGHARMNTPGIAKGNWGWRFRDFGVLEAMSVELRMLASAFNRVI